MHYRSGQCPIPHRAKPESLKIDRDQRTGQSPIGSTFWRRKRGNAGCLHYSPKHGVDSIDANMGCPVPKVTKTGGGASMMNELPKTQELIRSMVDAVEVPITAKMRLGWDDKNLTAPELARALEDAGVTAIFVHGRTRAQGFDGVVNLEGIRKVVEAVRNIPVIGNGDATTPRSRQAYDRADWLWCIRGRGAFTTHGYFCILSNTWKPG